MDKVETLAEQLIFDCALIKLAPYKGHTRMMFEIEGKTVGVLDWGSGELVFTGDADVTAKRFFEFLKGYVDGYIGDAREQLAKMDEGVRKPE